ncbi:ABC-2 family transporter protein [Cylindrospermopsis raciborskii]|nr:ABC-2 family transporter protein [Cylindrospermopsis raciborskii]MCZ2202720.1 ABC-2 family transporter protein [Cylindrospermopsis raciborskii PAMP2012]MCZ2206438.1 ABC-2 family transporter protein [Cylindrospermopsis raciborskii PAMP2011]OHY33937.1 multidrug ABC transporter permease [Cylindrospermopsis raciborskii MVCC14]OPH11046.1 multidrug ABC transporter permease [Cylindrospermopsis raciborskii CENA302]
MKYFFRKAHILLTVYYAYMLEYRSELLLWVLSGSLPIIIMGVWNKAAQGGNFGLSPLDFTRYFFAVFLFRQLTVVWVIYDFEREVVEGKLSNRLLQPLDPVFHHLASHIGERFARMPFVVAIVGIFFAFYPQAFWIPSFTNFFWFTLAAVLSFALRFLIQYTLAMLAFWTERATSLENFWFLLFLFLSGMIAPLEVFPPAVKNFALWTPFPYLIHFPASILVGLPVDLTRGFLSILAWLCIFGVANRLLWRLGLKQYSGMGA